MELNSTQLSIIREYVALGWKYPDIQIMISDHIKYRVQDLLTENRTMTVEQAVKIAHKEFGQRGFKVFEDETKATLKNKYDKVFWEAFTRQLNFKGLLITITAILWFYLFYVDVRLPEVPTWYESVSMFIPFIPIYSITFSMFFKPVSRYRRYLAISVGNIVMNKWGYIGIIIYILYTVVQLSKFGDNCLFNAAKNGLGIFAAIVLIRSEYAVRQASLSDCKLTEAQNVAQPT